MLRGSGVNWDLRRDDPYWCTTNSNGTSRSGRGKRGPVGSCWDRHIVRMKEMEQSVRIIEQALAQIPDGDVQSAIPKRIRPNPGEVYARTESPRGELGFYIVSDGTGTLYRIKARSPALSTSASSTKFRAAE